MTRAAIYARYSSDRQNALSVGDQINVCMRHAEAQGWSVTATFSDAAISGAAMANRPGLLGALAAADRGDFDVLLCEDEDRIARNLEHLAHVANRLRRADGWLATLSTPRVETMHVAFKGLIAEDYLRSLSEKTKRGVRANAERGKATGSKLFGYRTHPGGEIEIVEEQAEIIRSVFSDYLAGKTARAIASRLNVAGVPGPRGGAWNASTINGSRARANGILRCEMYAGVKVWNRLEVTKDAFTGARKPRERPKSEWKRTPVPHLRIVDERTWVGVQARKAAEEGCRPEHLVQERRVGVFSGLLKCGQCGSSFTAIGKGRLGCAGYRERGPAACGNGRTIQREELEARVLEGLKRRLLAPDLVAAYVRAYHDAWRAQRADVSARREPLERRLAEIRRAEQRTIDAIERGTATEAMEARMMERDGERKSLEAELAVLDDADEPPIELHPRAADRFAGAVAQLQAELSRASGGDPDFGAAVEAVRTLVERIEVRPMLDRLRAPYEVILHGRLSGLLGGDSEPIAEGGAVVVGGRIGRSPKSVPGPFHRLVLSV